MFRNKIWSIFVSELIYRVIRADGFSVGPKADIKNRKVAACREIAPMIIRLSEVDATSNPLFAAVDLRDPRTSSRLILLSDKTLGIRLQDEPATVAKTYSDAYGQFCEYSSKTHCITTEFSVCGLSARRNRRDTAKLRPLDTA